MQLGPRPRAVGGQTGTKQEVRTLQAAGYMHVPLQATPCCAALSCRPHRLNHRLIDSHETSASQAMGKHHHRQLLRRTKRQRSSGCHVHSLSLASCPGKGHKGPLQQAVQQRLGQPEEQEFAKPHCVMDVPQPAAAAPPGREPAAARGGDGWVINSPGNRLQIAKQALAMVG